MPAAKMFNIPVQKKMGFSMSVVMLAIYLVLFGMGIQHYFVWDSLQSIAGIILLLYVLYTTINISERSIRYLWPTLILLAFTLFIPARTFLYFAFALGLLFFIEFFIGKCGVLPLFIMAVISPLFNYVFTAFTFPIKLQLSQWAAALLTLVNNSAEAVGNIISVNGNNFSVDDACMGISMTGIGLLTGVAVLVHYKNATGQRINFLHTIISFIFLLLLLLITNVFRIVILAQFKILPNSMMHEITGLVCFIVYFLLPSILLTNWMIKKQRVLKTEDDLGGLKLLDNKLTYKKNYPRFKLGAVLFVSLMLTFFYAIKTVDEVVVNSKNIPTTTPVLNGYDAEWVSNDILKCYNNGTLLYIKGIANFYNTEHSPLICWTGSGFELLGIKRENIAGINTYAGELQQGNVKFYTAWWFDNGEHRTIEQLDWRWRMLKGHDKFVIVNIVATSKDELDKKVYEMKQNKQLKECIETVAARN